MLHKGRMRGVVAKVGVMWGTGIGKVPIPARTDSRFADNGKTADVSRDKLRFTRAIRSAERR